MGKVCPYLENKMIYRLSFPDGFPLPKPKASFDIQKWLADIVANHRNLVERCDPGVYNLTPSCWTTHRYIWTLHIFDDMNNGFILAHPRYEDAGIHEIIADKVVKYHSSGQKFDLPGTQNIVGIMGPYNDKPTIAVFEIIFHLDE